MRHQRLLAPRILVLTLLAYLFTPLGPHAAHAKPPADNTPAAAATPDPADVVPLTSEAAQEQWTQFFAGANENYHFDPGQTIMATKILEGCISRARTRFERLEARRHAAEESGDTQAQDKARAALATAAKRLNDELIGRIDALATIEQITTAAANGFESPRTRNMPKAPEVWRDAPAWELKTPEGKITTLTEQRGKVVLMHFWASWCGYCKKASPAIQRISDKYKDQPVAVFGVNCKEKGDARKLAKAYLEKHGYTYPQLIDGSVVAQVYEAKRIPLTYVIGGDGKIIAIERGFGQKSEASIVAALEKGLKSLKN